MPALVRGCKWIVVVTQQEARLDRDGVSVRAMPASISLSSWPSNSLVSLFTPTLISLLFDYPKSELTPAFDHTNCCTAHLSSHPPPGRPSLLPSAFSFLFLNLLPFIFLSSSALLNSTTFVFSLIFFPPLLFLSFSALPPPHSIFSLFPSLLLFLYFEV